MRITARIVARFLIVLSAALSVFFLTGRLNRYFFQDVSQTIPLFVGGTIVTVFGQWVFKEAKAGRSATADGKLNPFPGSRVFRIMVGEVGNLAALIRQMRIRHGGIALMATVVVVGLVVAVVVLFPRRAQPSVTSSRPSAVPLVTTSPASPSAPAEKTMRDGVVSEIASSETGQCVEVRNLEKIENAIIDQGTCQGGANQKFKMISGVDPGTFKIQALHSGKCMTVTDDKRVVQVTCVDSTQFWRFRWRDAKRGWNYWEIRNTAYGGGFCLDLPEYSHAAGTPLQARECKYNANNIANNQQWRTRE